jgi:hypothetical protein
MGDDRVVHGAVRGVGYRPVEKSELEVRIERLERLDL